MTIPSIEIQHQILSAIHELGEDIELESLKTADIETPLIGSKSDVDSITLVNIIVDVEERLADKLNINVILADERAMSQRRSPFRNVKTLTEYVMELQQQSQNS